MEIYEVEESDPTMWPFSERIYIVTKEAPVSVEEWLSELEPSSIDEGYVFGRPAKGPEVSFPFKVWGVWWD